MTQQEQPPTESGGGVENHLAKHGKLSYLEIPALDTEISSAFYNRVFGWAIRGDTRHRTFDDGPGDLIGAFSAERKPASDDAGPLLYLYVQGLDATIDRIKAEGCAVVREPYPEGALWVATFRDPAGNLVGLWQGGAR